MDSQKHDRIVFTGHHVQNMNVWICAWMAVVQQTVNVCKHFSGVSCQPAVGECGGVINPRSLHVSVAAIKTGKICGCINEQLRWFLVLAVAQNSHLTFQQLCLLGLLQTFIWMFWPSLMHVFVELTRTSLLSGDSAKSLSPNYPTHHMLYARMLYTDSIMHPDGANNIIHINNPAVTHIYFSITLCSGLLFYFSSYSTVV